MLQEAIDLQKDAVSQLLSVMNEKEEIFFKAPTGSGKTYMMADLMNQYLSKNSNVIFIVSTLSKGNLAKQNYDNFDAYKDTVFKNLNPYLINTDTTSEERLVIPTDYNVYVLPRDLYKENGKLKRGAMIGFIEEIERSKKIIVIKDECHQATNNLDNLSEHFYKVINFSATPKLSRGQYPDVQISELAAINSKLIKTVEYRNNDGDTYKNLDKALDEFEELKEQYIQELNIHPCFIIQISNKHKADEEWEEIKNVLNNTKHQDLDWMLIVNKSGKEDKMKCDSNDRIKQKKVPVEKWKDFAKSNNSSVDVIIFKMVISEGWDIPRACMLFQVRDTESEQLDEQIIGRVRRNPRLLDFEKYPKYAQEMMLKAVVWGIKDSSKKEIKSVELKNKQETGRAIKVKTTQLKNLTKVKSFDVNSIIKKHKKSPVNRSIFELYDEYKGSSKEVQEQCRLYAHDDYSKWFKALEALPSIKQSVNQELCDYKTNMTLVEDGGKVKLEKLPDMSYFEETDHYKRISDWVWKLKEDDDDTFSFDSVAEKEWAEELKELSSKNNPNKNGRLISNIETLLDDPIYLWGKNYLGNSNIKYEYYLNGVHSSYPDFVMLDYKNRIHLFEVKSVNYSNNQSFDKNEYNEKINALKECYKYSSELTGHHFWIPIKEGSKWNLFHYSDGNEETLSYNEFLKAISS